MNRTYLLGLWTATNLAILPGNKGVEDAWDPLLVQLRFTLLSVCSVSSLHFAFNRAE
jgi:hypothetical protein